VTQKARVVDYVRGTPGKTACQIAKALGLQPAGVSSILYKGIYSGLFRREKPTVSGFVYFSI
jgi:hypothetical protein